MNNDIKTVHEVNIRYMARCIETALDCNMSAEHQLRELRQTIRNDEKQHRRGFAGNRRSVALTIDLFTVKTIADAVKALTVKGNPRRLKKTMQVNSVCVRADYLQALRLVATHLKTLFKDGIVKPNELFIAASACDYQNVICDGEVSA